MPSPAARESQLMRRLRLVYESRAPGLLEAGREEGPSPATKHPGAGLSLAETEHDTSEPQRRAKKVRSLSPSTLPLREHSWSSGNEQNSPKTLRCKSRGSEWLSMPNVGLTAAFAAPQGLRFSLLSRVGHSFATRQAIFTPAPHDGGTVFELRSEPWNRGLQVDSRMIRQKRAEAAAQRLAGLGWAGLLPRGFPDGEREHGHGHGMARAG